MPSPFPGMDPYLGAPDIWPDFHISLVAEISAELNAKLPAGYYARIQHWPEPATDSEVPSESRSHRYIEIRDARRGHELTTIIEFVSP